MTDEKFNLGIQNAVRVCMNVTQEDKVLIISDLKTISIGKALANEASRIGAQARLIKLEEFGIRPMTEIPPVMLKEIANFKPSGFVHMLDYKEDLPIPDEFYKILADNNIFVVTTGGLSLKSMDEAPPFMKEWVNNNLLNASERAEIIKRMYDEGILIVTGTDAQDEQMNFSDDYFLELELYERAGLPNLEILKAATGNAAKAFDLPIGALKIGSKANFVLLDENPLDDISNLKTVNQVWKNGKIK